MIQVEPYSKKQTVADLSVPVIIIKDLYKSFEKNINILKGVDLTVNKGENLVVLGKSESLRELEVVASGSSARA